MHVRSPGHAFALVPCPHLVPPSTCHQPCHTCHPCSAHELMVPLFLSIAKSCQPSRVPNIQLLQKQWKFRGNPRYQHPTIERVRLFQHLLPKWCYTNLCYVPRCKLFRLCKRSIYAYKSHSIKLSDRCFTAMRIANPRLIVPYEHTHGGMTAFEFYQLKGSSCRLSFRSTCWYFCTVPLHTTVKCENR